MVDVNKVVRMALDLLKLSVGVNLSGQALKLLGGIVSNNGFNVLMLPGGRKRGQRGGMTPELIMLEKAAIGMLKFAVTYELSKDIVDKIAQLLRRSGARLE